MRKFAFSLVLTALLCSLPAEANTGASSPYELTLKGPIAALTTAPVGSRVRLNARIFEGSFNLTLRAVKYSAQSPKDKNKFFVGKVKSKSAQAARAIPKGISLALIGDELRLNFFGRSRARSYAATVKLSELSSHKPINARLKRLPSMFPVPCGQTSSAQDYNVKALAAQFATSALVSPAKTVRLITEADSSFYNNEGGDLSSVNAEVLATINSVNGVWEPQIGVSFDVVAQYNQTSSGTDPYASTANSGSLLAKFLCNRNPIPNDLYIQSECSGFTTGNSFSEDADLYHLFTGQTMQSSVIGLAYVGVVCQSSDAFSFGLTAGDGLVSDSLKYLITAHEIGHNFNAEHVTGASVMSSTFSGATTFSSGSISTITDYVNNNAQCLEDAEPSVAPDLALSTVKFTTSNRRVRLTGQITNNDPSLSSCSLTISSGKSAGTATDKQHGIKTISCPYGEPVSFQISSKSLAISGGNYAKTRYFILGAGGTSSEPRKLKIKSSSKLTVKSLVSALNKGFPG